MRLLRAVHEATKDLPPPAKVTLDSLGLRVDRIRLVQAAMLAGLSGWLKLSGSQATEIEMTPAGKALVEKAAD